MRRHRRVRPADPAGAFRPRGGGGALRVGFGALMVLVAGLVTSPCAAAAPTAPSAISGTTAWPPQGLETFGMRVGSGFLNAEDVNQLEAWLGQPIAWMISFADRRSAADMRSSMFGQMRAADAFLPKVSGRHELSVAVPLAFGTGSALSEWGRSRIREALLETAAGTWDDAFVAVAGHLVAGGYGDSVIRLGHEMTGAWYPWSAIGNGDAYIAAYRHVHDVLARVAPQLRFEWTASFAEFPEWGPQAYPGDDYVDVIGLDVYHRPSRPVILTGEMWENRYGPILREHLAFTIAHGKPVSYPEWANDGIDEPEFVRRMYEWFEALPEHGPGRLLYQAYFHASKLEFSLDNYPYSEATFRELFGTVPNGLPLVTPVGAGVAKTFRLGGRRAGTVDFAAVDAAGHTTIAPRLPSGSLTVPYGFVPDGLVPYLLQMSTDAVVSGPITVCVDVRAGLDEPGRAPQLLQSTDESGSHWQNRTVAVGADSVCGALDRLGTIAVGRGFNTAPTARDAAAVLAEDGSVVVTLEGVDADGDDTDFVVWPAQHGRTVERSARTCHGSYPRTCSTTVRYVPDPDFWGVDPFRYSVTDGRAYSPAATVGITVDAVDDLPRVSSGVVFSAGDRNRVIVLRGEDPDGGPISFVVVNGPSHATVSDIESFACTGGRPNQCTARIVYRPEIGWAGFDRLDVRTQGGSRNSNIGVIDIVVAATENPKSLAPSPAGSQNGSPVGGP